MIEEYDRIIARPIVNMDDLIIAVETLSKFRTNEVSMDMDIMQAEVCVFAPENAV